MRCIDQASVLKRSTCYQPFLRQKIERAVDGRNVHRLRADMHHIQHLFGGDVLTVVGNCIKDHFALRGNAVPTLAQNVSKRMCHYLLLQLVATTMSI